MLIFIILFKNWTGLKNLDSLILAHNQLSKVPANVFSHLPLLNSLELEGNQITYVDKDAFAGLEGKLFYSWYEIYDLWTDWLKGSTIRRTPWAWLTSHSESFRLFITIYEYRTMVDFVLS